MIQPANRVIPSQIPNGMSKVTVTVTRGPGPGVRVPGHHSGAQARAPEEQTAGSGDLKASNRDLKKFLGQSEHLNLKSFCSSPTVTVTFPG
jgi:hypothetical protein